MKSYKFDELFDSQNGFSKDIENLIPKEGLRMGNNPITFGIKKGDIKRIYSEKDRRMVYIELTTKGIKSLQEMQKNKHTTIEKIFGKLNNIDKKTLIKIFEKIHAKNI